MYVEPLPLILSMLTFAVMGGALVVYFYRFQARMRDERCSLCGLHRSQVQVLIRGDDQPGPPIYICEGCVGVCNNLLHEKRITPGGGGDSGAGDATNGPLPEPPASAGP